MRIYIFQLTSCGKTLFAFKCNDKIHICRSVRHVLAKFVYMITVSAGPLFSLSCFHLGAWKGSANPENKVGGSRLTSYGMGPIWGRKTAARQETYQQIQKDHSIDSPVS